MSPQNQIQRNSTVFQHWERFIRSDGPAPKEVRPVIADSWLRCRNASLDPSGPMPVETLSGEELRAAMAEVKPIMTIAGPFLNAMYATIGGQDLIIHLTDSRGWVMECFGDTAVLSGTPQTPYHVTSLAEAQVGTNAVVLALLTGKPQQVFGAEHYHRAFHHWATSAAPIRNPDGQVAAALSVSGPLKKVHSHTLGMIMASALAIEHKLKLNALNRELLRRNDHLNALMESISEGMVCVDPQGLIRDINGPGTTLLGCERKNLTGQLFDTLLEEPLMPRLHALGSSSDEQEFHIRSRANQKNFLLSAVSVKDGGHTTQEYLLTFAESTKIYRQANRITGARAIYTFDDILGNAPVLVEAKHRAHMIADSDVTVLLSGESGTGKELFAQSIHNTSRRRDRPFVFINCGAIPRDLVASELFGYVEGAFTGARKGGQPGKFELADGGTLFLDEIADMPLDAQSTLLRVLESRQVVRVGGHEVIPVDVRVIAASHKELPQEVTRGTFRADLYYRLNVMPIRTPALRERREDIRLLTDNFYRQFTRFTGSRPPIGEDFYYRMEHYPWPGNVRELQNIMQMVTNLTQSGQPLTGQLLPVELKGTGPATLIPGMTPIRPAAVVEKEMLEQALKATGGQLAKTASLLEIGRSTLYRKIVKYGIQLDSVSK